MDTEPLRIANDLLRARHSEAKDRARGLSDEFKRERDAANARIRDVHDIAKDAFDTR